MDIGVDLDGVVIDSHAVKPLLAKTMFGVDISPEDCTRESASRLGLLTVDQYNAVSRQTYQQNNFPMDEIHQACHYINLLRAESHNIRAVTSRSNADGALHQALLWLSARNLNIPVTGVGYGKPKTEACQGLDMFIDDDLEKLLPLVGQVLHLLLFSSPTNRQHAVPTGIHRVDSWWEVYNYIHEGGSGW